MPDSLDFRDHLQPNYLDIGGAVFTVFTLEGNRYQVFPITAEARAKEITEGEEIVPIREGKMRKPEKVVSATRGPNQCWTIEFE